MSDYIIRYMMLLKFTGFILFPLMFFVSCSDKEEVSKEKLVIDRKVDPVQYSRGARLYQLNCAKCHGKNAEGTPNWRKTGDDGMHPPPPLNGTGHTWHHPTKVLVNLIKNGTAKIGGKMPAWKDKLSDQQINDILTWVKAQWTDEVYAAWYTHDIDLK